MMYLVQFKKNQHDLSSYHLKFDDGYEMDISNRQLRDNCPCASCSGEEVLFRKYEPVNKGSFSDEGYILEQAQMVGNYAIRFFWKDGHNTGIYTWEHLRKICP